MFVDDMVLILDEGNDFVLILSDESEMILEVDEAIITPYDHYGGVYEVIPILHDDQVLSTNSKIMDDNVTVKPIPIVHTLNPYGGDTVLIG